jgi:hypothetical protein
VHLLNKSVECLILVGIQRTVSHISYEWFERNAIRLANRMKILSPPGIFWNTKFPDILHHYAHSTMWQISASKSYIFQETIQLWNGKRKSYKPVCSPLDRFLQHKLAVYFSRLPGPTLTRHLNLYHHNELRPVSMSPKMVLVSTTSFCSSWVSSTLWMELNASCLFPILSNYFSNFVSIFISLELYL